ncbi:MAG: GGDEF domain-containing protein [Idiomarina sp.]|nr:GGDEF domain-containing protein [Idiomarina sp.]
MPFIVAIPLLLWVGMLILPSVFNFVAVELSWLRHVWLLYAALGFLALLSGLMRQWVWWYWLILLASVYLFLTNTLAHPLQPDKTLFLAHLLPPLFVLGGWLLSSRTKPPLWAPQGLLLALLIFLSPHLLAMLPWSQWLTLPGLELLTGAPVVDSIATSWVGLLTTVGLLLAWWVWRVRRVSQPRHWAEFALVILLLGSVLSSQQPLLLNSAFLAGGVTILLGLSMQMLNLAYIDELTQLPGRRALLTDMRKLGRRSAVSMLDVDHFKKFNDTYGHDVGDQVLRLIAAQLKKEPGCKAYRYGGEEFTLLFSHDNRARIEEHLESVRQRVANYPLQIRSKQRPKKPAKGQQRRGGSRGKQVRVTISLGCAVRQQGESANAMLTRADGLLYKAKKAGRNRAVIS